ncbi:MAG: DUF421 domain-containing protein [Bacteroidota bacterium]|nr:DUF421 domain-containing protein [Bacteroidota bacterium]
MSIKDTIEVFDWKRIVISENIPVSYLAEIGFRTLVMFMILILALKLLSKRGVKQLSIFELAIMIALASATGDSMFYYSIPLTYGIVVLIVVILCYKLITGLSARSKFFENLLEGKPIMLLYQGKIDYNNYKKTGLPYDKFFGELRLKSVDHLGQVRKIYLETSGELSVYMFDEKEVIAGLPIYPESIGNPSQQIVQPAHYACIYCGNIQHIEKPDNTCSVCENIKWILPISIKRIP